MSDDKRLGGHEKISSCAFSGVRAINKDAQLVTVPILEARFLASEAKIEAKIDVRFRDFEARFDARFAASDAMTDARFRDLEAKVDTRFAAVDARFEIQEAKFDRKLDRLRLQVIIAFVIGNVALGPLANAALEALRRAL